MNLSFPKLKRNISLAEYTTFRIGGKTRYFYIAKTKEQLVKSIKAAKRLNVPFFILGGGSNLLVSDHDYSGLVIKCQTSTLKCQESDIYAGAGVRLSDLLALSQRKSLTGLEWAAGIPGTLGGAIFGNAGWPNDKKNISSVINEVEVMDTDEGFQIEKMGVKECKFGYRDSIFKNNKNLIILGASLKLENGDKEKIERDIAEIIKKRKDKIPAGFSAGCVFKNPSPAQISPKFMAGKGFSAGELIDQCGLKGLRVGGAQVSGKHANFILNRGNAKAEDVLSLIKIIKQKVNDKFDIILEEETQYLK